MNRNILTVFISLIILAVLFGGWFVSREENVIQEDSILPEVTENHSKSTTEQSAQQSPQAPPSSLETLASQMKEMSLPNS